jgi:hypothetical protein
MRVPFALDVGCDDDKQKRHHHRKKKCDNQPRKKDTEPNILIENEKK